MKDGDKYRTVVFPDMCAPKITFLPALSTLNLHRADYSLVVWQICWSVGKNVVVVEEGISSLHYSNGQSLLALQTLTKDSLHSSASTNQTAVRHYVSL